MLLLLIILNIKPILQGIGSFISLFKAFFIGIAIAFILNRPCIKIEKLLAKTGLQKYQRLKKCLAVALTYILLLVILFALIMFIIPELVESIEVLFSNINYYFANLQQLLNKAAEFLAAEEIDLSQLITKALDSVSQLEKGLSGGLSHIVTITTGVFTFFLNTILALIFSIYLLVGKEKILGQVDKVLNTYLPPKIYLRIIYVYRVVVDVFNQYLVGQLTEALVLGLLIFIGMMIFRFDYPLLISVIIGVTALVPYIGAYIGGLIAFLLILMISPLKAVMFLIFLVVMQQFEGGVIYPRVVGSRLGVPGVWVFLAATVGAGMGGPLGILLGVPIATVIYTLLKNDVENKAKLRAEKNVQ